MSKRATALFLALVASSGLALGQATPEPPRPPKVPKPPRPAQGYESRTGHGATTFDQKASFVAKGVIEIENFTGSVKVAGWDRNEIAVTGRADGAEGLELTVTGERASIQVDTVNPHGTRAELDVKVPSGSSLEINAFQADVDVSGVSGNVNIESVNGTLTVAGAQGELELNSVNGAVEISGTSKRVQVEAVNGDVTLKGVGGRIEASTVNGQLKFEGGTLERASFETVSGMLVVVAALHPQARVELQSVSGPIELALPADTQARFEASSFSGDIKNELSADQPSRRSKFTGERELSFTLGSGGATVDLQSLSGQILLRKR